MAGKDYHLLVVMSFPFIFSIFSGDPDKMDLMGFTSMHHAAQNGHINCVTFLVNFGANVWAMDNEHQTPLDIAALQNREDIVKFLDETQNVQLHKSPKVVQALKEKAMKEADRNAKYYLKIQDKASKELERSRRKMDKIEIQQNGDFQPPNEESFIKKLTLRMKGTNKYKNAKNANGTVSAFSDLVNVNSKSGTSRRSAAKTGSNTMTAFKVSEYDDTGKRTIKSVKGTLVRKDAQVLYVTDREITESGARPALTNVFHGTTLDDKSWNKSKKDNLTDSGNDSFDSNLADEDEAPGIFNRPNFGQIAFRKRMDHLNTFKAVDIPIDDLDPANCTEETEFVEDTERRHSSGTDSFGTAGSSGEAGELPWKPEDVEFDDDEEENEFSTVIVFLESCGLTNYTKLFTDGEVDMDALMRLTNQDFQDMGLPIGPRRKLMDAIQRRRVVLTEPAQMYDSQL